MYREQIADVPGVTIFQGEDDAEDNFWLTSIVVDEGVAGWKASDLSKWLGEHDIESRPLWKPMHMQPVFAEAERIENGSSEGLFETGVTLPSGSSLGLAHRDSVKRAVVEFAGEFDV